MATFIQIGNWLDFLRENEVYDNTKIIIVADHGLALFQSEELNFVDPNFSDTNAQEFFPLLMVKDFNSEGFTTCDDFMTHADVPTLATQGTIDNPINPFTGKPINSDEKYAHDQFIIVSNDWVVTENNGNTFLPARWISVKNNLWNKNNWKFYNENAVLKEHCFP
jgi:membrane-anchored protein YejM (alkaline phosphatase superfamily)